MAWVGLTMVCRGNMEGTLPVLYGQDVSPFAPDAVCRKRKSTEKDAEILDKHQEGWFMA